jgi:hypothetical protein
MKSGLIARRVTGSKAIAVEYSLTQLGRTVIAPLEGMCRWAKRYGRNVSADVHLRKSTGCSKRSGYQLVKVDSAGEKTVNDNRFCWTQHQRNSKRLGNK